jgi:3-phenylpropionate/cinnamic acid dioxygenase small subunit
VSSDRDEIDDLVQRNAILDTLTRYTIALDENEIERLLDCFAKDAELSTTIDHVFGHEAIRERYERLRGAQAQRGELPRHVLTNVLIERDGDRARATSYYTLFIIESGTARLKWIGRYLDQLVRDGSRWRLHRREILVDGE